MEDHLGRREDIMVEVGELQSYLLAVAGIITVLEKIVTEVDTGGLYSSREGKAMWWQSQGGMRPCKKNWERDYKDLQEAIESMSAQSLLFICFE